MPGEARALLRRGRVVALQWKRLPLQQEGQAQDSGLRRGGVGTVFLGRLGSLFLPPVAAYEEAAQESQEGQGNPVG